MRTTIVSYVLGKGIAFSGEAGKHIYADLNGRPGPYGNRIYKAGRLEGTELKCATTQEAFRTQCNNWYRSYVRDHPDRLKITWAKTRDGAPVIDLDTLLARIQLHSWQHAVTVLDHVRLVDMTPQDRKKRCSEFGHVQISSRSGGLIIIYKERFDCDTPHAKAVTRSSIPKMPSFQVGGAIIKKTLTDTHPMDPFVLSEAVSKAVGHPFHIFDYTSYFGEHA